MSGAFGCPARRRRVAGARVTKSRSGSVRCSVSLALALASAGWVALVAGACASNSREPSGSGGAGSGGGGGRVEGPPTCVTPEGVRTCGGGSACPWLGAEDCAGGGCRAPYDRELGARSPAGVCFSDLPDYGNRNCLDCVDGEVCLEREPGELYCVPESVCAELWRLGARGVCRYADLSAYDGRLLPAAVQSCPLEEPTELCGGACGACGLPCDGCNPSQLCTGRSPDHPVSHCERDGRWCALDAEGWVQACTDSDDRCGVYRVGASDLAVALAHGRCLGREQCQRVAREAPGGFDCYGADGRIEPPAP